MKRIFRFFKFSLSILLLIGASSMAHDQLRDYELKAVLLYKLTKFVSWPDKSAGDFEICVYGQNPFGNALSQIEQKTVNDQAIKIRYLSRIASDLDHCRVLFIANTSSSHLNRILLATSYSPTLTVSDIHNFADFGGMIELTNENQQIGFRINLKAAKAVDLSIASPLLELATIVSKGD